MQIFCCKGLNIFIRNVMEINREFYGKVLEDFQEFECRYICHASVLFKAAWNNSQARFKIAEHANKFLLTYSNQDIRDVKTNTADYLFWSILVDARAIRIFFLKWAVQNVE